MENMILLRSRTNISEAVTIAMNIEFTRPTALPNISHQKASQLRTAGYLVRAYYSLSNKIVSLKQSNV